MHKTYDPKALETQWRKHWEESGIAAPHGKEPAYCIMLPPPNVTGSLHMGHGFQQTLMDILIRYHIMRGDNTLWQGGVDHAGIATQMVVENQLFALGKTRHDLGRETFIARVWEWKQQSGSMISSQIRRLGALVDWSRERFTMDEVLSKATREVFVRLYEEGLIYRSKRLVNWDPQLLTAISDLEVENEMRNGHLWHIRYPLAHSKECLVVATTRPETLLGDVAVAVHPNDERYQKLIGKTVKLPLCDREIPIIADEYVQREFGTGCVKITPAHDFNDYAVGQRHRLTPINIFKLDASLNETVPQKYQGLDRFVARKQIVADLTEQNLIEKIEDYTTSIPICTRSGAVIEPLLTDQWFVKIESLAKPAIEAVEKGEIKFIPENWVNTYMQWMHNIQDWCISRQLWWGHRIPAWYDTKGNVYVGHDEAEVRRNNKLGAAVALQQDHDVLDTWFTSALWPFATLGWPDATADFKTFYPTNVLITGFDIIFFWVARMIMFGLKFAGQVPFKEVYINGLIRDAAGKKMSKSKGNVLDPIDLIDGISLAELIAKRTANLMQESLKEKIIKQTQKEFPQGIPAYGTDALRFTYCALANTSRDINFDMNRVEGYRNFCNKLWNAARFVLMNTENFSIQQVNLKQLNLADRWILHELQLAIQNAIRYLAEYRFDLLAHTVYEFAWNIYCDWYLEFAKVNPNPQTQYVLLKVFETILRLCHPIIPFITEEIWQEIAPRLHLKSDSLLRQPYPTSEEEWLNDFAAQELNFIKEVITAIRTIRSEMNVPPGKQISLLLKPESSSYHDLILMNEALLMTLAKINTLTWLNATETPPPSATAVVKELECHIPLADVINREEELARVAKEIAKLEKEREKLLAKLQNPSFIEKAPAAVVEKNRSELAEIETTLQKLK